MSRTRLRLAEQLEPAIVAARIAAAPAADEGVMVLVAAVDGEEYRHGPCYGWPHRSDARLPRRDDPCAVYEDSDGNLWIANWRPKGA